MEWIGIEPNQAMHEFLFEKANEYNINARLLECTSENISLPDNSVDYVISTEVLCSVVDLKQSLKEIFRVLMPNGKFLFLEHVIDKNNFGRRLVQKTVPFTPWKWYSDGCNPGRDIGSHINQIGFAKVEYSNYMQEGKGIINLINKPHIYGYAIK
ncbi:class I SAM-dependent methyltransferase [Yeosuana sp. MJ-SS3]|uniref:Class I SAM-dependent methyltransferase n=1 Tax=Gilvirhabdus luticola TaxID=3079858 RepID=A0ABU3U7E9_9FLAO|nr:class I SAM-dependent methyltransferase [Yeosuana sp. MJ-SS3]MDU8886244.1 class I SAM-dependent methyltransferase [Yeosuana sp. MJ-SS3]